MRSWGALQLYFFRAGIKPPDKVSLLSCEPQNALLIEGGSVRVCLRIRHWVLCDLACFWIQFADVMLEDSGEPDVSLMVGHQSVWAGSGSLERVLFDLPSLRIQPAQLVGHLSGVPEGAIRSERRIVRPRIGSGNIELFDGDIRRSDGKCQRDCHCCQ